MPVRSPPEIKSAQFFHQCMSRELILRADKRPALNLIVVFIRSCSVPLRLGKYSFMIEQSWKIRSRKNFRDNGSNTLLFIPFLTGAA